jgi:hypothetical protein
MELKRWKKLRTSLPVKISYRSRIYDSKNNNNKLKSRMNSRRYRKLNRIDLASPRSFDKKTTKMKKSCDPSGSLEVESQENLELGSQDSVKFKRKTKRRKRRRRKKAAIWRTELKPWIWTRRSSELDQPPKTRKTTKQNPPKYRCSSLEDKVRTTTRWIWSRRLLTTARSFPLLFLVPPSHLRNNDRTRLSVFVQLLHPNLRPLIFTFLRTLSLLQAATEVNRYLLSEVLPSSQLPQDLHSDAVEDTAHLNQLDGSPLSLLLDEFSLLLPLPLQPLPQQLELVLVPHLPSKVLSSLPLH